MWPKTSSPGDRPPRCPDPPTDRSESVTPLVSSPTGSGPPGRRRGGADPNTGRPAPNAIRRLSGGSAVAMRTRACPISWNHPNGPGDRPGSPPCNVADRFNSACLEPVAKGLHITLWTSQDLCPPSGRRWDRPGHQRSDGPSDPQSGGPPAASHAVLADVSHRHSLQGACREDPLVLRQRRAVGPAGLLGGLCRSRNPTSKSPNQAHPAFDPRLDRASSITRGTARSTSCSSWSFTADRWRRRASTRKAHQHYVQELRAFRHRHRHLRGVYLIHDNDPTDTARKDEGLPGGSAPAGGEVASPRSTPRGSTKRSCWSAHSVTTT